MENRFTVTARRLWRCERGREGMEFEFRKAIKTKTMGLRLDLEDYKKVFRLAKKNNRTRTSIVSEIVKVSLKEIKG